MGHPKILTLLRASLVLAILANGAAMAQSTTVGATGWHPPYELDFRIFGAIPSSAWASKADIMLPDDVRFSIDEACVIWSRVTSSRKRCRAVGGW